jgi:hypothetical protein
MSHKSESNAEIDISTTRPTNAPLNPSIPHSHPSLPSPPSSHPGNFKLNGTANAKITQTTTIEQIIHLFQIQLPRILVKRFSDVVISSTSAILLLSGSAREYAMAWPPFSAVAMATPSLA